MSYCILIVRNSRKPFGYVMFTAVATSYFVSDNIHRLVSKCTMLLGGSFKYQYLASQVIELFYKLKKEFTVSVLNIK